MVHSRSPRLASTLQRRGTSASNKLNWKWARGAAASIFTMQDLLARIERGLHAPMSAQSTPLPAFGAFSTAGPSAGWMMFALLVPVAIHCGREASETLRDPDARAAQRALAWALLGLTAVGGVSAVIVLGRVIQKWAFRNMATWETRH
jgi:hypothetical protein